MVDFYVNINLPTQEGDWKITDTTLNKNILLKKKTALIEIVRKNQIVPSYPIIRGRTF